MVLLTLTGMSHTKHRFSGKYVAVAMSVSSQLNWACNFIVGLVFPYLVVYLGPYSFGPFACVLLAVFLYSLFILPETQGSSPEELAAELSRTMSKSVIYQHNEETANQIDVEWRKAMEQLQQEEEAERQAGVSLCFSVQCWYRLDRVSLLLLPS